MTLLAACTGVYGFKTMRSPVFSGTEPALHSQVVWKHHEGGWLGQPAPTRAASQTAQFNHTLADSEKQERPGKFLHAPENGLGISWVSWLDEAENSGPRDHRLSSNERSYSLVMTTQERAAADQEPSLKPNVFNRGLPRRERPWRKAWIDRLKGKKVRKHVWDLFSWKC